MRTQESGVAEVAVLPPKSTETDINRSVYLPSSMWDELTQVAEESKEDDPQGKGYSRNEVIKFALRDFLDRYNEEKKSKRKR